ncbi:unnamed protein product [Rotaria sp. Silwood1]|nr:unnamed protein product [Rotaria sp. Silwood1]
MITFDFPITIVCISLINNTQLNVSDGCNLFVHDQKGNITPCIDFEVYGKEQDFRMFMCTKWGENRPLVKSLLFTENSHNTVFKASNSNEEIAYDSIKKTLQRSLVTKQASANCDYIDINDINKWLILAQIHMLENVVECIELEQDIRKYSIDMKKEMFPNRSKDELYAEMWTKSYLNSIGSKGIIHSVNTGKNGRFIMCNIRNMDTCTVMHEDYFNDSTVYNNLKEKEYTLRCNRIPCNKNAWIWHSMN